MITGHIVRQRLNLCDSHVVADTIDYLEAKFFFKTDDWDGLEKWVHFANGDTVYDIPLTDGCIRKEDHLNLSAGVWSVYLHGNAYENGEVVERITTDIAPLYVHPTGTLDGEPFPEIPASVVEQINARLARLESGGTGGGTGGGSGLPIITAEAEGKVLTAKGGFPVWEDLPRYDGAYSVTPSSGSAQTLETAQKYMDADVRVEKIPYYEIDNGSGGTTVYIGSEDELTFE